MAFRVLRNGVVECDTIEELRQLQGGRPRRSQPTGSRRSAKSTHSQLSDTARALIVALLKAPAGLHSEAAAKAIGIGTKSLPPQLRLIAKWCRDQKLTVESLLTQKVQYINRRPQTLYQLTDDGRTTLPTILGLQSINGKESQVNSG